MAVATISSAHARGLVLAAAGLHKNLPFGRGLEALARAIDTLGYVQIDTISVIERAHHHICWSRVPNYQHKHLHQLQKNKRRVFEYWAHAAAYLPISDYRYSLPLKDFFRRGEDRWPKSDPTLMTDVLERIKVEGPMMARDFAGDKTLGDGWWDWKPAKLALERLFFQGDLMITERRGFQKVYDLPERILPSDIPTGVPTGAEMARHLIERALRTHGLVTIGEICYLRRGVKEDVKKELRNMEEAGEIIPVQIVKKDNQYYTRPGLLSSTPRIRKQLRILSPFDPVIIQRQRLRTLFDFDYQIECYVPQEKRRYGYFCLPLLFGRDFIGRVDMKADRKTKTLQIKKWYLEKTAIIPKLSREMWFRAFQDFAVFNDCTFLEVYHSEPSALAKLFPKKMEIG